MSEGPVIKLGNPNPAPQVTRVREQIAALTRVREQTTELLGEDPEGSQ